MTIKSNQIIQSMKIINYNNVILKYNIMKRLSCLICSVNITFVKTKGEYIYNL